MEVDKKIKDAELLQATGSGSPKRKLGKGEEEVASGDDGGKDEDRSDGDEI